eukprot:13892319-Alexandrium_andersonii.AAC.1
MRLPHVALPRPAAQLQRPPPQHQQCRPCRPSDLDTPARPTRAGRRCTPASPAKNEGPGTGSAQPLLLPSLFKGVWSA